MNPKLVQKYLEAAEKQFVGTNFKMVEKVVRYLDNGELQTQRFTAVTFQAESGEEKYCGLDFISL